MQLNSLGRDARPRGRLGRRRVADRFHDFQIDERLGRPEGDWARRIAMSVLGIGLSAAGHHEDALSVNEAELSMMRRLGDSANNVLTVQTNLATAYSKLGRHEEALRLKRDVYSGMLNLFGQENNRTFVVGNNYATALLDLKRFKEAKSLLLKTLPVARRVLGENDETTLRMRWYYAVALLNTGATLDDLREAVTTLEDLERTARRVFGGEHPFTGELEDSLREVRAALRAREGDVEPLRAAVEAMAPGDA